MMMGYIVLVFVCAYTCVILSFITVTLRTLLEDRSSVCAHTHTHTYNI